MSAFIIYGGSLRSGIKTLLEVITMRPSGLCGFELMDKPPDHTVTLQSTSKNWDRKACLKIFNIFKGQLQGYMGEVFNLLLAQNKAIFMSPRIHRLQTATRPCRLLPRNALPSIAI